MQIDSATFGAVIKRNGSKLGIKKERERERENGIERALRQRKTIDETFYIVTTTIQSWHGSWRHLLRFGIRYDKVGAEKLRRGDN